MEAVRQTGSPSNGGQRDVELLDELADAYRTLVAQVERRIVGQREVVDNLFAALLAGGHALLVGVPGLAKTLIVHTVAEALDLTFSRIQFTPDLLPGDITGSELLEEDAATGRRAFRFVKGPVFANVVLADEINRAPPKTQAALLQAMQEHSVTVGGQTHTLPEPFFVLATQNPIEQEGTYPLPEAQLDRFMLELRVDYPTAEQEELIARTTTSGPTAQVQPVLSGERLRELQLLIRRLPIPPSVVKYAVQLARATRPQDDTASDEVRKYRAGARARCIDMDLGKMEGGEFRMWISRGSRWPSGHTRPATAKVAPAARGTPRASRTRWAAQRSNVKRVASATRCAPDNTAPTCYVLKDRGSRLRQNDFHPRLIRLLLNRPELNVRTANHGGEQQRSGGRLYLYHNACYQSQGSSLNDSRELSGTI